MGIRCTFGHDTDYATWNSGFYFGACDRCGQDLIKAGNGRWHAVPEGYTVRWDPNGSHALAPSRLIRLARQQAPLLHRLRRRRPSYYGGYFTE